MKFTSYPRDTFPLASAKRDYKKLLYPLEKGEWVVLPVGSRKEAKDLRNIAINSLKRWVTPPRRLTSQITDSDVKILLVNEDKTSIKSMN